MKKKFKFDTEKSEEELVKEFKTFLKVETKPCYNWRDIKTFEYACKVLKIDPKNIINSNDTKDEVAYKKLKIVVRAINGDWTPDFSNSSQYKYYPYFDLSGGCRFCFAFYDCSATVSVGGVRLCFESKEKSNFAGKTFEPLYADLLT